LGPQSSTLEAARPFLQGLAPLGEERLLALFTDLSTSQRHLVVIADHGRVLTESTVDVPMGLVGGDHEASLVYFNVARPTGGEVLVYKWYWNVHLTHEEKR
jgi:hypothetical protein